MRKKTLAHFFDNVLWYTLYLLPVFAFLTMLWRGNITLAGAFSACGLDIFTDGIVFDVLNQMFGVSGAFPLFNNPDLLHFGAYFISVFLLHIVVDVLLFIPRFAHKCMDCFGGDK